MSLDSRGKWKEYDWSKVLQKECIHSNDMSSTEEPTIHRIESFEIEKKNEANNEATIDKKEVVPTQPPVVVDDIPVVSYLTLKQVVVRWKNDQHSLLLL